MFFFLQILTKFDFPRHWQYLFQDPATSIMENIIDLHHDIVFFQIMIITFVLWMLIRIFIFFNSTNRKIIRSLDLTHNTLIEIIWTLIPTIILILIALPSYVLIYNLDEMNDPRITLKIIGHQWYWSYEYSDYTKYADPELFLSKNGICFDSYMLNEADLIKGHLRLLEVDNNIFLPTNVTIRLIITASDVIHSWTIPSLGLKLDAVPGRLNQVGTYINRESLFYGQCSELCGINHSFMPIGLKTLSLELYDQWVLSMAETKTIYNVTYTELY
jgi:cytochrome c oxidase subunit 2